MKQFYKIEVFDINFWKKVKLDTFKSFENYMIAVYDPPFIAKTFCSLKQYLEALSEKIKDKNLKDPVIFIF
jgi:hypothetical protein